MKKFLASVEDIFYFRCPEDIYKSFMEDTAHKNCFWLNGLAVFSLVTQILFYIVYLNIAPLFNAEFEIMNKEFYKHFTIVHVIFNSFWAFLFAMLEKRKNKIGYSKFVNSATLLFLTFFTIFESVNCSIKIGIFSTMYRFIAIFLVLTVAPTVSRIKKSVFLACFGIFIECGLWYLSTLGYSGALHFKGLVAYITLISIGVSHILFTRSLRNYKLHFDLENSNSMLRRLNEKLQALSATDPLTKIANRRAFNEYIETMWNESKRSGMSLSLMMFDIDNFKLYNDKYGHPMGDKCLIEISEFAAKMFVRSTDMVARYGGEEFVVFLPHSSLSGALFMAEKLRAGIEGLAIESLDDPRGIVTISIGVHTAIATDSSSKEEFIGFADTALYKAKAAGRNKVFAYSDDRPGE